MLAQSSFISNKQILTKYLTKICTNIIYIGPPWLSSD